MNRLAVVVALAAIVTSSAGAALAQRGGSCETDRYRDSRHDRHGSPWSNSYRRDRDRRHRGDNRAYAIAASLEAELDRFARSLDHALDRSRWNGSRREDVINEHAKRLERQTDRLKDRRRRGRPDRDLVQAILAEARHLDRFMRRNRLERRAEQEWRRVARALDRLASRYRLARWQRGDDGHRDRHRGHDHHDRDDRDDRRRNRG
jgi:hypothetical protein